jgi:hypothetical protein
MLQYAALACVVIFTTLYLVRQYWFWNTRLDKPLSDDWAHWPDDWGPKE